MVTYVVGGLAALDRCSAGASCRALAGDEGGGDSEKREREDECGTEHVVRWEYFSRVRQRKGFVKERQSQRARNGGS